MGEQLPQIAHPLDTSAIHIHKVRFFSLSLDLVVNIVYTPRD